MRGPSVPEQAPSPRAEGAIIERIAFRTGALLRVAERRDADMVPDIVELLCEAGAGISRRILRRGEVLRAAGDPFECLYSIRAGFLKTRLGDRDGHEQVTGFFMSGELLGLDAIAEARHRDCVVALEESVVCPIPYGLIDAMGLRIPSLQRSFNAILSAEIVRSHGIMMLLGSLCAEERLAAFLLNLGRRLQRCGWSATRFKLHMTRADIGSYLGLQLETVSRLFSDFRKRGLIEVDHRQVTLRDVDALERLLSGGGSRPARAASASAARR